MFELRGVSKAYPSTVALHSADLDIPSGATTVLLGPSGCGKSTVLRLLVGLIEPDSGQVLFEGKPLTRASLAEQRRRMGYVIQEGGLFPHLTGRANALLMPRYLGWSEDRADRRLADLMQLVQLSADTLKRYPGQLSGGQRQRISLMRALMLDPHVLLLDEPLGALDPMIRSELQGDLKRIFQQLHKTVVMVTHDLGEAAFLGDHIVLLREGHIAQRGKFSDLFDRPADAFVTRFINAQRPRWAAAESETA